MAVLCVPWLDLMHKLNWKSCFYGICFASCLFAFQRTWWYTKTSKSPSAGKNVLADSDLIWCYSFCHSVSHYMCFLLLISLWHSFFERLNEFAHFQTFVKKMFSPVPSLVQFLELYLLYLTILCFPPTLSLGSLYWI